MLLICACAAIAAQAQSRTKLSEDIYLANYGTLYVIENDRTQQTVRIKVTREKTLYDVFCNDTIFRTVAKAGLKAAIEGAIISASSGSTGSWVSGAVASDAADRLYNWACAKLE